EKTYSGVDEAETLGVPASGTEEGTIVGTIQPRPMSSLMSDVPRDLEKVIFRCLGKDPGRRFEHMDDLTVALLDLKDESEPGKVSGVCEGGGRARSKSLLVWVAGIIGLVLSAAGGLWLRFFHRAANSGTPPRIVPLTSHAGNECCPSFSADGNQVAFVWNGPK